MPGRRRCLRAQGTTTRGGHHLPRERTFDARGRGHRWHCASARRRRQDVKARGLLGDHKTAIRPPSTTGRHQHDRGHEQAARRFLDRVVGFLVSPCVGEDRARVSAGACSRWRRAWIVEREREIRAFIPDDLEEIHALVFQSGGIPTTPAPACPHTTRRAEPARAGRALQGRAVQAVTRPDRRRGRRDWHEPLAQISARGTQAGGRANPGAPFLTSTLQQAALRLGFRSRRTMTWGGGVAALKRPPHH